VAYRRLRTSRPQGRLGSNPAKCQKLKIFEHPKNQRFLTGLAFWVKIPDMFASVLVNSHATRGALLKINQ